MIEHISLTLVGAGYLVGLIGVWVGSDGAYSIALYLNAPSFRKNERQSWSKDHAIRLIRIFCGVALVAIGGVLLWCGVYC